MNQPQKNNGFHEIQSWLISEIAQRLDIDRSDIDIREPFENFGLSSSEAVILLGDIEEWLDCPVSPTLIWDYPTIEELAKFLSRDAASTPAMETHESFPVEPDKSIAIIGMACRFPGADSIQEFWNLLRDGRDAITEIPPERWDASQFYSTDSPLPGKMVSKYGGFIQQPDGFDSHFFGISPREAECMDPQQRLLMEISWEALENAGIPADRLAGTSTGVFVGICTNDYSRSQLGFEQSLNAYYGTGTAGSIAANRLSYYYDLRGPSISVDTACSSSLVAVHLACQNLLMGDCDTALAGGVNLILSPDLNIVFSQARMLSPDGRCKTFDASANGYVRGEGCGIVVLKPLGLARRDGDPVLAIIRGSAVNQDGRSNGLTAPNGPSQESVIRTALRKAGLQPAQIDYVETHGTGTPLGDPIEAESLKSALQDGREPNRICYFGSVKTNIGHLEASAGIAGLIKSVLILQHRQIPPHLHFEKLNPHISLDGLPFSIPAALQSFPVQQELLRCGVSSFGFGGTNAHIVLEEAPPSQALASGLSYTGSYLIPLSARSSDSLKDVVRAVYSFIQSNPDHSLQDIAYTLTQRRTHLNYRLAVAVRSRDELAEQLHNYMNDSAYSWVCGQIEKTGNPNIVFVFSGQGGQWAGMGRDLFDTEPVFTNTIHQLETLLAAYTDWSLIKELKVEEARSRFDRTEITQPVLFALQVALVELWRSWGIVPHTVVGHSIGEIAAAYTAGFLQLEDAVRLVVNRGKIMRPLHGQGKMAVVNLPAERISSLLGDCQNDVCIAAINSPSSTVLSGSLERISRLVKQFEEDGISVKVMTGEYAFHSPQMLALQEPFIQALGTFSTHESSLRMISTVSGDDIRQECTGPNYWAKNIREPVLFSQSIERLIDEGNRIFVEIGPHPVLCGNILQTMASKQVEGTALPSMRRRHDAKITLLQSLGALHTKGASVNWKEIHPFEASFIPSPNYPWKKERYWLESNFGLCNNHDNSKHPAPDHPAIRSDWLYRLRWIPQPAIQKTSEMTTHKTWIVLCDSNGIGRSLSRLMRSKGFSVYEIYRGDSFSRNDEYCFTADPSNPSQYRRLITQILSASNSPQYGFVYCWGMDATIADSDMRIACRGNAEALVSLFPIYLQQAIQENFESGNACTYLVTQTVHAVGNPPGDLSVLQSLLWGIGRCCRHELASHAIGMIDLSSDASIEQAALCLFNKLCSESPEEQIAYSKGSRYAARFERFEKTDTHLSSLSLCGQSAYLITGGLGTLGLRLAQRLAERGAKEIILMGRTPLPDREAWNRIDSGHPQAKKISLIQHIESMGSLVRIVTGDVSSELDVKSLFDHPEWAPIRGIVHAAGDLSVHPFGQIDETFLSKVTRAKVHGSWLLHQFSKNLDLDFFVLFSSASSFFAPSGHTAYAAANAFMDSLAVYRKMQGLPAASIGWGVWEDSGVAARPLVESFQRNGMEMIDFESGLNLFEWIVMNQEPHLFVIPGTVRDWLKVCPEIQSDRWGSELSKIHVDSSGNDSVRVGDRQSIRELIQQSGEDNHLPIIRQFILSELARILGIDELRLDPSQSLMYLGFDSLMAVEMKNRIETSLGVVMPIAKFLEGKSINDYSQLLFGMMNECDTSKRDNELPQADDEDWDTVQI